MAPLTAAARAAHAANRKASTSSSSHLKIGSSHRNSSGRIFEDAEKADCLRNMSENERRLHNALRDVPDTLNDDDMGGEWAYEDDVLHGRVAADISHAGEAMTEEDIELADESLLEHLREHHNKLFGRYRDPRTRRDRTQILVDAFASQMQHMADAYLTWSLATGDEGLANVYLFLILPGTACLFLRRPRSVSNPILTGMAATIRTATALSHRF
ncbi:hypothetical protein B0H11DRAFT_1937391 [Mycena galericulata]|nr:hypothetical protein B0H11DRAFT_1937391 [Mycena galericulata]